MLKNPEKFEPEAEPEEKEKKEKKEKLLFKLPENPDLVRQLALKLNEYNERIIGAKTDNPASAFSGAGRHTCAKEVLKELFRAGQLTEGVGERLTEKIMKQFEFTESDKLQKKDIKDGVENYIGVIGSYCEGKKEEVFGGTGLPEIKKIAKESTEKELGGAREEAEKAFKEGEKE